MRRLAAAAGVAVALAGCPKKGPEPAVVVERPPVRPALLADWSAFDAAAYDELRGEPRTVAWLAERYDVARYTPTVDAWGELPVLQFEDTDRREVATGALAGWVLDDRPDAGRALGDPLGAAAEHTVSAVVLRDFLNAPTAESAEALAAAVSPPWTICRPAHDPDLRVAYDESRGLKLGLVRSDVKQDGPWAVDHLEVLSAGLDLQAWWQAKGYGGCAVLGAVDEDGRYRPDKNAPPEEPAAAAEES